MSPNFLGAIAGWLKTLEEMQRQRILLTDAELQKTLTSNNNPPTAKTSTSELTLDSSFTRGPHLFQT
jgi:hypothetical protein